MARPTKLTYEIQQRIGDNIALGLPYLLPLKLSELRIRHFTTGTRKAKIQNLENTLNSINLFKSVTQMPLKNVLNVLMNQQKQEIARFACGFWRDVSRKTSPDDNIVK
jgi:hypothetical protein